VLTQPLVEETEDGASALTLQRLARDAHDEIPRLQRGSRRIRPGRETCNPAQAIQVHAQRGNLSCGAFELIARIADNRLVGRNVGAGYVLVEEGFVRTPRDAIDDTNQILGAEPAAALVEVGEERPHDVVEARCAVGVVTNGEVEERGEVP